MAQRRKPRSGRSNKKTYPPHQARPHTRRMCSEPASRIPHASNGPGYLIGLLLARLYTYLVRLDTTGQRHAPSDIAHLVISAEANVHAFVRALAAAQLQSAGYHDAASAMRTPAGLHTPLMAQAHADPVPTAELIERLKTTIADFEQADVLASLLARIIVCTLACLMHDTKDSTEPAWSQAPAVSAPNRPAENFLRPWPPPLQVGSAGI